MSVVVVDVEGAAKAWADAQTDLCGPGRPLTHGVHLQQIRSPSSGVWATVELAGSRALDDTADRARVSWTVRAVGSEQGPKLAAARAAAALAVALEGTTRQVLALPHSGVEVLVVAWGDLQGPLWVGSLGGEQTYRLDATLVAQPA